jgi:hypothetical protein
MAIFPFPPGGKAAAPALGPRNAFIMRREPTDSVVEFDDPLARVLANWRELRGAGKVPPERRKLVPEDHLRPVMGFAHIVDCSPDDPMNYLFRLFGSRVSLFGGEEFTKRRVIELPDPELAERTASDYFNVINKGCPAYHKVKVRVGVRTRSYTRLLLPLTNDQRQTVQLLVCFNPRPLPELGDLPW